jgi:hypothetical protein
MQPLYICNYCYLLCWYLIGSTLPFSKNVNDLVDCKPIRIIVIEHRLAKDYVETLQLKTPTLVCELLSKKDYIESRTRKQKKNKLLPHCNLKFRSNAT